MSYTPKSDRLISIDALRGIAVLGILMVNVQAFAMFPWAYEQPDTHMDLTGNNLLAWEITHTFFAYKFITIFSTLFGAGIVLMIGDSETTGRHYPRMLWLLLIGMIHAYVFWWGDILVSYALIGMIAVRFRNLGAGWLLFWAAVLILISGVFTVGGTYLNATFSTEQNAAMQADMAEGWEAAMRTSFITHLPWNAGFALIAQISGLLVFGARTLGLMLIGMVLFRSGFLSAQWSMMRYVLFGAPALIIGLFLTHQSSTLLMDADFAAEALTPSALANYAGSLLVSFGYASVVMIAAKIVLLKPVVGLFAATGRMAFTNYLTQTLIMTAIFVGTPGLGLFGEVERADQAKIVMAVWVVQLIWSPLWLSRFRFGPLEWLWRTLTYGKIQPLLK